jgi:hypothetical protein
MSPIAAATWCASWRTCSTAPAPKRGHHRTLPEAISPRTGCRRRAAPSRKPSAAGSARRRRDRRQSIEPPREGEAADPRPAPGQPRPDHDKGNGQGGLIDGYLLDGLYLAVANKTNKGVAEIFEGSMWRGGVWNQSLALVDGAIVNKKSRFGGPPEGNACSCRSKK